VNLQAELRGGTVPPVGPPWDFSDFRFALGLANRSKSRILLARPKRFELLTPRFVAAFMRISARFDAFHLAA
jgi:hypothetical protein